MRDSSSTMEALPLRNLRVILVSGLLAVPVPQLGAQASIEVVTADGTPIPAVFVEFWGRAERLGSSQTTAAGRVEIAAGLLQRLERVSFSFLGFETVILLAEQITADARVVLAIRPVELEGRLVTASGSMCPSPDDPRARALWEDGRARYATTTGVRGGAERYLIHTGFVRETELFQIDEESLRPGALRWTGSVWPPQAGKFRLLEERVRQDGYAWDPVASGSTYLNWGYPPLHGRRAYHFATDAFGELHDLSILSVDEGGAKLAFCPNDEVRELPNMRGVLRLSPSGEFLTAEWRFETPDPQEDAGGEVVFTSHREATSQRPHLMAGRGIFFRHDGKEPPFPELPRDYTRVVRIMTDWFVSPDGEFPRESPWDSSRD